MSLYVKKSLCIYSKSVHIISLIYIGYSWWSAMLSASVVVLISHVLFVYRKSIVQ